MFNVGTRRSDSTLVGRDIAGGACPELDLEFGTLGPPGHPARGHMHMWAEWADQKRTKKERGHPGLQLRSHGKQIWAARTGEYLRVGQKKIIALPQYSPKYSIQVLRSRCRDGLIEKAEARANRTEYSKANPILLGGSENLGIRVCREARVIGWSQF